MNISDQALPAGQRVALSVEYDGSEFHGWQRQASGQISVQETLENALSSVANAEVRVACAGRTDAGVHATNQIVSFESPVARSPKAWVMGGNASLPPQVRVNWARGVAADFHARFSAVSRTYRYVWATQTIRSTTLYRKTTWSRHDLDVDAMQRSAACLIGEHDFSAFRAASCQSNSPHRRVDEITFLRRGSFVVMQVTANAFLHHMVRNLAGSIGMVGRHLKPEAWIEELLEGRNRTLAADTAPPDGLYLVDVGYPAGYNLPNQTKGPIFLCLD